VFFIIYFTRPGRSRQPRTQAAFQESAAG